MARIPTTTFKDWKDGDTVVASEYERELEIIRAAVNDNHDRVETLQNAAGGSISRIPHGSAFPTGDIQPGQIFFRSDQELLYILGTDMQWEPFSPKSFIDAHINNDGNPHNVTASQTGAYSKAETDNLFVSKASTGAFFGKGSTSANAGFQILSTVQWITELDTDVFQQTGDGNNINFKKGGLYQVNFSMTRSDLIANHYWKIGFSINNDVNKWVSEEMVMGQYGWNQSGGPNLTKVPLRLSHIVRVDPNDYINFNIDSTDGPRSYENIRFSVIRIGD